MAHSRKREFADTT